MHYKDSHPFIFECELNPPIKHVQNYCGKLLADIWKRECQVLLLFPLGMKFWELLLLSVLTCARNLMVVVTMIAALISCQQNHLYEITQQFLRWGKRTNLTNTISKYWSHFAFMEILIIHLSPYLSICIVATPPLALTFDLSCFFWAWLLDRAESM